MLKTELIVQLKNLHCALGAVLETLHTVLHFIITQTLPSRCFCPAFTEEEPKLRFSDRPRLQDWKQRLEASAPALPLDPAHSLWATLELQPAPTEGRWKERLAAGQLI